MAVSTPTPHADRCAGHPARLDYARAVAGMAFVSGTCEFGDMRPIGGLYRTGTVRSQHLAVLLRHAGPCCRRIRTAPTSVAVSRTGRASLARQDRALRARQIVA